MFSIDGLVFEPTISVTRYQDGIKNEQGDDIGILSGVKIHGITDLAFTVRV